MIQLHCTKKLLPKLPLDAGGRLQSKRSPLGVVDRAANDEPPSALTGWHANLVLLQRRQCVLFVHDATRFPVLVTGVVKADFAELDYWFQDGLMNTLLKCGATESQLDAAHKAITRLVCDTECNRSVQGTMNQFTQSIEHLLWYDNARIEDISAYRTGAWLADSPCSFKPEGRKKTRNDYLFPKKEMLALLDGLAVRPN